TSALVTKTAPIGEFLFAPRGCRHGEEMICWRRSGDAFKSSHRSPSALMARLDWLRGLTRLSPLQASRQTGQRQFHCGKPPPAAEPKTRMRTTRADHEILKKWRAEAVRSRRKDSSSLPCRCRSR